MIGGGVGWQAFDDFGEVVLGIEILRAAVGEQGVAERLADVVGWALFFIFPKDEAVEFLRVEQAATATKEAMGLAVVGEVILVFVGDDLGDKSGCQQGAGTR